MANEEIKVAKQEREAAIKALAAAYEDDCIATVLARQAQRALKNAATKVLATNQRLDELK